MQNIQGSALESQMNLDKLANEPVQNCKETDFVTNYTCVLYI